MLEHLYYGNATHVFYGFTAHALNFLLVAMKETGIFAAHHHAHAQQCQCHRQKAKQSHAPIKHKEQCDGGQWRDHRGGEIRHFVRQQVFCERGVIIDELAQPSGLVGGKKTQRQLENVAHGRAAHVSRCSEGGDMGTHQRRKIEEDADNGKRYRYPAPAG